MLKQSFCEFNSLLSR